jgi:hypothetical protein
MSASKIKHENTFCIKKMHLEHLVNSNWLTNVYVDKFMSDANTCITSSVDKAKKDFGVDVPKRMAYMENNRAMELVLSDHKKQYQRIRDYLQTVIDKNTGSWCSVTSVIGPTEEKHGAMQRGQQVFISDKSRFHGIFLCVNATR